MKERNSNFELMRIISMILIVTCHTLGHGGLMRNSQNETLSIIFTFIFYFVLIHVNSFVLLTGYHQCNSRFKQSKLWYLISSSLFYKVVIMIIFSSLGLITLTKVQVLWEIFPLNVDEYWYVKFYFLLYCISPILNYIINRTNKQEYKNSLIILFIILSVLPFFTGGKAFSNGGYNLTNFILLYFIGAYLRKNPVKESYLFKNLSKNAYRLILIILLLFVVTLNFMIHYISIEFSKCNTVFNEIFNNFDMMTSVYSNPLIIIQSVLYFLYFETLDIKSKFINKVASLTLGVYYIHDNNFVRGYIYKWIKIDNGPFYSYKYLIYMIIAVLTIFIICSMIEFIRQLIFKLIGKLNISKKIKIKYYNYIKSISFNKKEELLQ